MIEQIKYTKKELEDPIGYLAKEIKKLRKKIKKLKHAVRSKK
jgi:predicted  nucleic acid-binding Zn-ribbon protein